MSEAKAAESKSTVTEVCVVLHGYVVAIYYIFVFDS